jgi:DNA-binding PadR family transcriptional regulator
MSTTRLLILGAVRIFQPVHGYLVRRELLSWHVDNWAHLNPGSVYNALHRLAREGLLVSIGTSSEGSRPARTTYRLTPDGENEFLLILRQALWTIAPNDPSILMAGWSFAWALRRGELIEAFEHRLEQIRAWRRTSELTIADLASDVLTPPHVAEHWRLVAARLEGEAQWLRDLLVRLRAGELSFAGEPGAPSTGKLAG